jgi:hypothetical protein
MAVLMAMVVVCYVSAVVLQSRETLKQNFETLIADFAIDVCTTMHHNLL